MMIYDPSPPSDKNPAEAVIPQQTEPSNPMPLNLLPKPFAEMSQAIVKSARVPPSLAGCCVLGALSASIGSGLRVSNGLAYHRSLQKYDGNKAYSLVPFG